MKKFLACVLAVVLTLSLGAVAFAKEVDRFHQRVR